jgi:hypothetical protein
MYTTPPDVRAYYNVIASGCVQLAIGKSLGVYAAGKAAERDPNALGLLDGQFYQQLPVQ